MSASSAVRKPTIRSFFAGCAVILLIAACVGAQFFGLWGVSLAFVTAAAINCVGFCISAATRGWTPWRDD